LNLIFSPKVTHPLQQSQFRCISRKSLQKSSIIANRKLATCFPNKSVHHLCWSSHRVCLIQNDNLEWRTRFSTATDINILSRSIYQNYHKSKMTSSGGHQLCYNFYNQIRNASVPPHTLINMMM